MPSPPALLAALALLSARPAAARHKKLNAPTRPRAAASASCDPTIPGQWTGFEGGRALGDLYALAWSVPAASGAWTATMLKGGGWNVGKAQLAPDNATVSIAFDSGVNLTGAVTDGCATISWDNDSVWKLYVPPPVVTDVHIIAMNHLDVGCECRAAARGPGRRVTPGSLPLVVSMPQ